MLNAPAHAPNGRAVVSKAAARSAGAKKYFTGKPCKNGHVSERWVSCGSCVGCQAITKVKIKGWALQYQRAWREKNRDKVNGYTSAWRSRNPDAGAAYMRARRDGDRETLLAQERARYAADPEKFRAKSRAYLRANKGLVANYARRRRALKVCASGAHTRDEIVGLFKKQGGRCANCKASLKAGYHADHILPLALGGSNAIRNIQLMCPRCNLRKGASHPIVFSQREGRLL